MNTRRTLGGILAVALFLMPGTSHARWLNPNTGRFQTMDTFEGNIEDPHSLHKLAYCANSPTSRVDPSGHEDIGALLNTLSVMNSVNNISFSIVPGSTFGAGGVDITRILKRTMLDVQFTFLSWNRPQRIIAANYLVTPSTGRGAWDILPLYLVGHGDISYVFTRMNNSYSSGSGLSKRTVTVDKHVYYAGSANYTMWGTMCRAIHDWEIQENGFSVWSLSMAKRIASAYKTYVLGDTGETATQAQAFTEYGYNGVLSSMGLPFAASTEEADSVGDILPWCWEPFKRRNSQ